MAISDKLRKGVGLTPDQKKRETFIERYLKNLLHRNPEDAEKLKKRNKL